jgi:Tfp pilus assembly protein PilX
MRRILRDETGSTLIAAVLIVLAMLGLGLALMATADTQSRTSARERTREASFNVAEAAMNAQALQLARSWPSAVGAAVGTCTPAATGAACPQASAIGNGYTQGDYAVQPCASAPTTPRWQTNVYDNVANEQYWTQAIVTGNRASYDANGDGILWVRSQATTQCHTVAMVSQAAQTLTPLAFPSNVVTANWIATSNQGKKVIIDTLGSGSQPAAVVARCAGLTTAQCLNYNSSKGQVQPPAVRSDTTASATTLTTAQLDSLKAQAQAAGSYFAAGSCPTTAAQLAATQAGVPRFVEGPCNISVTGNTTVNSVASPGALIVKNGTLTLGGTVTFYGMIYMVNSTNNCGSVLTIQGNANITGVVSIDGCGGMTAGSSKTNLTNDPRAATLLRGASAANLNKNTFRVVPSS